MSGFGGGVASLIMKTAAGDDGLVFHFDASDSSSYSGSGSTSWNDLSGNGNHATLLDLHHILLVMEDIWILMVLMIMELYRH